VEIEMVVMRIMETISEFQDSFTCLELLSYIKQDNKTSVHSNTQTRILL